MYRKAKQQVTKVVSLATMAENLPFVSSPCKLCFIIVVLCSSKGEPVFATLFCLRNYSFQSINKKYQKKVNEDEIMIESMTGSAEHKNHNSAFLSSVRITSLLNFFCMHIFQSIGLVFNLTLRIPSRISFFFLLFQRK